MKKLFILPVIALIIYACGGADDASSGDANSIPSIPASAAAAKQSVIGKNFSTKQVGTISPFTMDEKNPYAWMDGKKDSSSFTLSFRDVRMMMKMNFKDDKTVALTDDNKTIDVGYRFDTLAGPKTAKSNVVLLISIPDSSMQIPGITGPVMMTHTYNVLGADDKTLFLETPRSFNNQKVVVLMKSDK